MQEKGGNEKNKGIHGSESDSRGKTLGFNNSTPHKDKIVFSGPMLADVEKKVLAKQGLSTERQEINNGICGGKVTNWKRKAREEKESNEDLETPLHGARKKRDIFGGQEILAETPENTFEKQQLTIDNGSGLAEAVEQPRRPQ